MSDRSTGQPITLDALRHLFPITREKVYLFNGNIIPCATPVRQAMEDFLDEWARTGDACWEVGASALANAKALFAELIDASSDSIASIPNTTTGINMAAMMIRPQKGQNIVVTELEHMSDVYPWLKLKHKGVEVRHVPASDGAIEIERFAAAVDNQTAAVCLCHVTMGTGFRWDLAEVCRIAHNHGARVVVDAAQSVGAIPTDMTAWGVDILAAPTFKWLLGPMGAGFLYVCPELIAECDPPLPGWFGVQNPSDNDLHNPQWHETAHKFERGVPGLINYVGAAAGLQLLKDIGHQQVFDRIAQLTTYLVGGLSDIGGVTLDTPSSPQHRAGIVAMQLADQDRLWNKLEEEGIHVGNWLGYLRIDPACYNTTDELETLLAKVRQFVVG